MSGCGSLHQFSSAASGSLSDDKALVYEYSRISLGLILLILFIDHSVRFYPQRLIRLVTLDQIPVGLHLQKSFKTLVDFKESLQFKYA